jgi:hypothetical protein
VAGNNFDPNPAKYLEVYSDDPKFLNSLRELEEVDSSIGEANSPTSNRVMVRYLNVLLNLKEEEIQDRISLIQDRDKELQRLIDEIHRIYSSKRYKLGHWIIHPIEFVIKRLRAAK